MSEQAPNQSLIWMTILVAAAILFSLALACGMPFAALGALAALTLPKRDAMVFAGLGWLANQAIGFGFLAYPLDTMTFAWGIALCMSALGAVVGAERAQGLLAGSSSLVRTGAAFLSAWAVQQGVVFVASLVLGGTENAFTASVVWFIFWTNALAFVVLVCLQSVGARIGLAHSLKGQPAIR
ncbi:MAG: hypothetical protein HRU30_08115 [Rhodobacteraceae bacterium]|nr:hypothetical protein [Paracoccaceae bacterium]